MLNSLKPYGFYAIIKITSDGTKKGHSHFFKAILNGVDQDEFFQCLCLFPLVSTICQHVFAYMGFQIDAPS